MRLGRVVLLLTFAFVPVLSNANSFVADFEGLADLTSVTNQISGITFTNSTVLAAGVSLNEFAFPPRSGTNVVFDDGGAITILFASPVLNVGGYFTYLSTVTLQAFDPSDSLLGSVSSSFANNTADGGDPGSSPNELLQLAFASGVSRLTITGDPTGSSFVLDDLSVTTRTQVPEPYTASLLIIGVLAVLRNRQR